MDPPPQAPRCSTRVAAAPRGQPAPPLPARLAGHHRSWEASRRGSGRRGPNGECGLLGPASELLQRGDAAAWERPSFAHDAHITQPAHHPPAALYSLPFRVSSLCLLKPAPCICKSRPLGACCSKHRPRMPRHINMLLCGRSVSVAPARPILLVAKSPPLPRRFGRARGVHACQHTSAVAIVGVPRRAVVGVASRVGVHYLACAPFSELGTPGGKRWGH